MRLRNALVAVACLLICTLCVLADTLRLKDGTVLEGKVIEQGDKYWIKMADGSSKVVPKSTVVKFERGDAKGTPITPAPPAAAPGTASKASPAAAGVSATGSSATSTGLTGTSGAYATVKAKADRVDAPVRAVQLWEGFIATKPAAGDLEAAKAELARWAQLQKENAERIKGVWVKGAERKRIVKQAKNLVRDGVKQIDEGQSTVGFKKIEEAMNLYPQSFEANFHLGLYYLKKSTISATARFDLAQLDKAVKTLETATKIAPKSSSAWTNLAIGYSFKRKHKEAVETAYKAAIMHESPETVQNLVAAFTSAPGGMQQQAWCKTIMENAVLMAERHNVAVNQRGSWVYVPPAEGDEVPGADNPAGTLWKGSGFFVTTDGYILTNHHVATGDTTSPAKPDVAFVIRMDDGKEKSAELIALDDVADIAILKITPDAPVIPLKLSSYLPAQGSQVLVLGYPATGDSEHTLQIGPGAVKSINEGDEHEVWLDLNTTHGNSGGPIVDASNNMIGIISAYRMSHNMSIFLAVSSQQIKTFFGKVGDKAPKVDFVDLAKDVPAYSSEGLTKSARVSTVLVLAVRSAE